MSVNLYGKFGIQNLPRISHENEISRQKGLEWTHEPHLNPPLPDRG